MPQINNSVVEAAFIWLQQLDKISTSMQIDITDIDVNSDNIESIKQVQKDIRTINNATQRIADALNHLEAVALENNNQSGLIRFLTKHQKAANQYIKNLGGDPHLITFMLKDYV